MHFCVLGILSSLWCDSEHYLYLACMTFWKTTLSAFFSFYISVISWSRKHDVLQSCPTLFARMDYSNQATLSMGFSRQEYWSGLPCPPPGHLPDPGIEPTSSASPALQADSLLLSHLGSPLTKKLGLRNFRGLLEGRTSSPAFLYLGNSSQEPCWESTITLT